LSGLRKIETVLEGEIQEAWRPKHIFHYMQWKNIEPEFVIDISEFLDKKIAACKAFKTQFYDPILRNLKPDYFKNFLDSLTYRARIWKTIGSSLC
jgi:LmbE family N-acetylglucosaminyl deacetylase